MKPLFYVSAFITVFFACKKDHTPSTGAGTQALQRSLMAHTWFVDSMGTANPGSVVYQAPRITQKFETSTYYTGDETGRQTGVYHYELEAPNKFYYWSEGDKKNPDVYVIVEKVTDTSLILSFPMTPQYYQWCSTK